MLLVSTPICSDPSRIAAGFHGKWVRLMTSGSRSRRVPRASSTPEEGMPAGDMALVHGVLRRDAAAEASMIELLVPHLRVVATAILSNRADADEAVQLALMRVLKGLATFRGESTLVRWARRVATNVCLRAREQNQRRLGVIEPRAELEDAQAPQAPVGHSTRDELNGYLRRLPEKQREALILRHVLGYSVAEVSTLVGAPFDTVKSRLSFGRRALREMMQSDTDAGARTGKDTA
ncbi:MAG: RNA polymerase sigma factor [Nannocystaceae bacterium]|nr:RNA polymerase sigma factor [Nannocystaceae bacterium]